jgi:hypothetical protein
LILDILDIMFIAFTILMVAKVMPTLYQREQTSPLVIITSETLNKPRLSGILATVEPLARSVQTRFIPRFLFRSRATDCLNWPSCSPFFVSRL